MALRFDQLKKTLSTHIFLHQHNYASIFLLEVRINFWKVFTFKDIQALNFLPDWQSFDSFFAKVIEFKGYPFHRSFVNGQLDRCISSRAYHSLNAEFIKWWADIDSVFVFTNRLSEQFIWVDP